jgi:hypothetical protein
METIHPYAAVSLCESLAETATILRLNIPGLLKKRLRSLNLIESAFSPVTKDIKNWKNGKMVQRWTRASLLDTERRSNRIAGYRSMSCSDFRNSAINLG